METNNTKFEVFQSTHDVENGQRVSVLRVTQNGQTDHLLTKGSKAMDMMCTAECLRIYLLLNGDEFLRFAEGLISAENITPGEFDAFEEELRQNNKTVTVLDVGLDRGEFSVLDAEDGWKTYTVCGVCSASARANQTNGMTRNQRVNAFAAQLRKKLIRREEPKEEIAA